MSHQLFAGFGRADITPEVYGPLSGFGNDDRRICNFIMDRITGTCVAISDPWGSTVLLCTLDLLNAKAETVVETVRRFVSNATQIPRERIMVSVTHTHSGPATYSREVEATDIYLDHLGRQMAKAAQLSLRDREPSTILVGKTNVERMTFVRHYRMNDGTVGGANFGSFKSGPKEHMCPADEQLQLIRFARKAARDIVLANWQSHGTFIGHPDEGIVSADYIGDFRNHFEGLTGCHVAFFQGACGNLVPTSRIESENLFEKDKRLYGRHLAEKAAELLGSMASVEAGPVAHSKLMYRARVDHSEDHLVEKAKLAQQRFLQMEEEKMPGRYASVKEYGFNSIYHANQVINRSQLPADIAIEMDALCAGDIAFVTLPFEPFCSNGMYIKEHSPFAMTFVLGYCNGSNSYIADKAAFGYNCYEVNSRRFYEGTAEDIAEKQVQLLKKLKAL